jgi:membrane fusion protein, multidrug efflux system
MPDFDDKTRASADRLVRDRPNRETDSLADKTDQKCYPEAFGRSAPVTPGKPLPEAFGRAERETEKTEKRPSEEAAEAESKDLRETQGASDRGEDDAPQKPPFYKRPIPMIILGVVLVTAITIGVLWWLHARHFESTDDAFITGHIIRVAPRVSGQAIKVLVEDNQVVHQGDLLVQIDPNDFEARLAQSQADLQSAQGKVAEAESAVLASEAQVGQAQAAETSAATESERAAADLKRYEALDPRSVSQQQLDAARAAARTAQANVESARKKTAAAQAQVESSKSQVKTAQANVNEAQAALDQARLYLQYTKITAPTDGRVTNKTVEAGSYLQTGQALFSLVPRDVWIVANFKETQITNMRPGQPVTIDVDAYPQKEFTGHVDSFQAGTGAAFSLLPPENATGNYVKVVQRVPVKIVFDEPPDDRYLLGPGMSVTPKVRVK